MAKRSRGITLTAKPLTVTQAAAAIDALKGKPPMTPAEARLVEAAIKEHKQGNILHIKWATVTETDWDDFKLALAEYKRAVAAVVKERSK